MYLKLYQLSMVLFTQGVVIAGILTVPADGEHP